MSTVPDIEKDHSAFLTATELIDADHHLIRETAERMTAGSRDDGGRVQALFTFVRDAVPYSLHISRRMEAYRASAVLERGRGFCTQKAILFTTLARSLSLPAGIALYDIVDHTLPDAAADLFGGRRLRRHGIPAVHLSGAWVQADCTLHRELALEKDLEPVVFSGRTDAFMPALTRSGGPGITYERYYGIAADITPEDIHAWYGRHLQRKMQKNK
ncbi:transglutaminase domain-containing protein [bacterium]|nr:transglutaminase domain-containing protein [bacterium]